MAGNDVKDRWYDFATFYFNDQEINMNGIKISYKAKENAIVVLEDVNLDAPKTKTFSGILSNLKINNKKSLFVIPEYNDNLYLSLRNIQGVNGTVISDMNTYDILNANVLVMTESAAKLFNVEEA